MGEILLLHWVLIQLRLNSRSEEIYKVIKTYIPSFFRLSESIKDPFFLAQFRMKLSNNPEDKGFKQLKRKEFNEA